MKKRKIGFRRARGIEPCTLGRGRERVKIDFVLQSGCQRLARCLLADEVFMTGTAAEVTPVRAVDGVEVGVGPVTRERQEAYGATVDGLDERHAEWLHYVA